MPRRGAPSPFLRLPGDTTGIRGLPISAFLRTDPVAAVVMMLMAVAEPTFGKTPAAARCCCRCCLLCLLPATCLRGKSCACNWRATAVLQVASDVMTGNLHPAHVHTPDLLSVPPPPPPISPGGRPAVALPCMAFFFSPPAVPAAVTLTDDLWSLCPDFDGLARLRTFLRGSGGFGPLQLWVGCAIVRPQCRNEIPPDAVLLQQRIWRKQRRWRWRWSS